ncbi:MAG TPA: hypothetical protein VLL25_20260 [Acidimicrobiales bacterium]|nr:hypothetical protein [Acidimicrobiales bacterium]
MTETTDQPNEPRTRSWTLSVPADLAGRIADVTGRLAELAPTITKLAGDAAAIERDIDAAVRSSDFVDVFDWEFAQRFFGTEEMYCFLEDIRDAVEPPDVELSVASQAESWLDELDDDER